MSTWHRSGGNAHDIDSVYMRPSKAFRHESVTIAPPLFSSLQVDNETKKAEAHPGHGARVGAPASPDTVYGPCSDARVGKRAPIFPGNVSGLSMGRRGANGAPVASGTVSRVGCRHIGAPASPDTVCGPCLDARVAKRASISPSIVFGHSVGRRGRNEAPVTSGTVSRVGYRSVGAPGSMGAVSGSCRDSRIRIRERAPISPDTVSGPAGDARVRHKATVSPCTVSAVGVRSGGARRPNMWQYPDIVNAVRSSAGDCQPRVLSMGASGTTYDDPGEKIAAGMAQGYRQSGGSNAGGVADTRALEATAGSDDTVSSQDSEKCPPTQSACRSRPGKRKGMLTNRAKTCHGCRNQKERVKPEAKALCRGRENADGKGKRCHYWVCRKCLEKWQRAGGAEGNAGNAVNDDFICCVHTRGPCVFQR